MPGVTPPAPLAVKNICRLKAKEMIRLLSLGSIRFPETSYLAVKRVHL
jgi:hypothetical protein